MKRIWIEPVAWKPNGGLPDASPLTWENKLDSPLRDHLCWDLLGSLKRHHTVKTQRPQVSSISKAEAKNHPQKPPRLKKKLHLKPTVAARRCQESAHKSRLNMKGFPRWQRSVTVTPVWQLSTVCLPGEGFIGMYLLSNVFQWQEQPLRVESIFQSTVKRKLNWQSNTYLLKINTVSRLLGAKYCILRHRPAGMHLWRRDAHSTSSKHAGETRTLRPTSSTSWTHLSTTRKLSPVMAKQKPLSSPDVPTVFF